MRTHKYGQYKETSSCLSSPAREAEVWHQESATFDQNVRSKKSFQVAGSPGWMCGGGKSLDCEKKLELQVKSWHQGLKSRPQPREYDLQLIQYYVKQADQATIPMVNFLWHAKSLKLQVWGPKYMRKSGFTLSINPDKTQHYLSVALFAVKGRGPLGSPGIPTSNNQDSLCAQTKSIQPSNSVKSFKGS